MKARDIMSTNIVSINEGDPIIKAAQLMKEANIGSIPVKSQDQIVGILTDRDIVLRNVADQKDPKYATCGDIMSQEVVACSPNMDMDEIVSLMSARQIRRIPVVENSRIVGMISLGDLATKQPLQEEAGGALTNISYNTNPPLS